MVPSTASGSLGIPPALHSSSLKTRGTQMMPSGGWMAALSVARVCAWRCQTVVFAPSPGSEEEGAVVGHPGVAEGGEDRSTPTTNVTSAASEATTPMTVAIDAAVGEAGAAGRGHGRMSAVDEATLAPGAAAAAGPAPVPVMTTRGCEAYRQACVVTRHRSKPARSANTKQIYPLYVSMCVHFWSFLFLKKIVFFTIFIFISHFDQISI